MLSIVSTPREGGMEKGGVGGRENKNGGGEAISLQIKDRPINVTDLLNN